MQGVVYTGLVNATHSPGLLFLIRDAFTSTTDFVRIKECYYGAFNPCGNRCYNDSDSCRNSYRSKKYLISIDRNFVLVFGPVYFCLSWQYLSLYFLGCSALKEQPFISLEYYQQSLLQLRCITTSDLQDLGGVR